MDEIEEGATTAHLQDATAFGRLMNARILVDRPGGNERQTPRRFSPPRAVDLIICMSDDLQLLL